MSGGSISDNVTTRTDSIRGGAVYSNGTFKLSGTAHIPYGDADGTKQLGYNDIFLASGKKIIAEGNLSNHSAASPLGISVASGARGFVLVEADGTHISDLSSYYDFIVTTDSNWQTVLSPDKSKISLNSPFYVQAGALGGDGTISTPFATIEQAIDSINTLNDSTADYVILIVGELTSGITVEAGVQVGFGPLICDSPSTPIKAQSLTICGANGLDNEGNPIDSISGHTSDPAIRARGLTILTSVPVTIECLKITGGLAENGGAIYLGTDASGTGATLTLGNDVVITGNQASRYGGGIYFVDGATLKVKGNVLVSGNTNTATPALASNVYLPAGKTITVAGALNKESKNANIGVTTEDAPTLTSDVVITSGYGYAAGGNNAGVSPGTYFSGDRWGAKLGSGTYAGEAVLAASGGNISIEPIYEEVTIKADKSSFLRSSSSKVVTFTAEKPGTGSPTAIDVGSGEDEIALTLTLNYHGEEVPTTYYTPGTDNISLDSRLPPGTYTAVVTGLYKGRTYSATFPVEIRDTFGTKKASQAKAVGDIVFNDGSAMPYTEFTALDTASKNEIKTKAIALIFYKGTGLNSGSDTTTERTLGVGLGGSDELPWCDSSANSVSTDITSIACDPFGMQPNVNFNTENSVDRNGSDNLEQIAAFLGSDDDTSVEANYPAFYWAKNYKTFVLSGESSSRIKSGSEFESGWYLPSNAELEMLWKNGIYEEAEIDLNTTSQVLGGIDFTVDLTWSSSQAGYSPDYASSIYFSRYAGNTDFQVRHKNGSSNPGIAIAVREF